jgi:hypothetical protein
MQEFMKLYRDKVLGATSGWDRIRFRGTIRWLASERGINAFVASRGLLLKHFGPWAQALTKRIRTACDNQAEKLGIPMIYLNSSRTDKEPMARKIADQRGVREGDICMFSVVEPCLAPQVQGDRETKKLHLRMRQRKCVWIYHYWDDPQLGFGHTRLQTWLPLTATVCLNGRHWLERQLIREGLPYLKDGNCFPWIADLRRAQELLDEQQRTPWPQTLDRLLRRNCPIVGQALGPALDHYWSADETEWATDVTFRSTHDLDALFPSLLRYGIVSAQSPTVMRFFGKQVKDGRFRGRAPEEIVSDLRKRYEGFRLKHWINRNSVKMYNKGGNTLRVEATINATRDFKVFRRPGDDPSRPPSWQRMRKGVSDLHRRGQVSQACNERYLDSLAAASVNETLQQTAGDICSPVIKPGRRHRALNPFNAQDLNLLQFIARGEMQLNGFRNRHLRSWLYPERRDEDSDSRRRASGRVTRRIRLLRAHGLVKKIPRSHRYVLTAKGRKVATAILAASSADTEQLMEMAA